MKLLPLVGLIALWSGAPLAALDLEPKALIASVPDSVPSQATAAEQLVHALKKKRQLRGLQGAQRLAARREAVDAYRAVRRYFPGNRALGAEAAFRAGELLRSGHFDAEAAEEFELARDLGQATVFAPRGGLELAHLHRRHARLLDALAAYAAVTEMEDIDREYTDRARNWKGTVEARLGRHSEARRSWEQVARHGAGALERIDALDRWADSLVDAQDLEAAAGVLELCSSSLHAVADEETPFGLRVRKALGRMGSVSRLARAIKRRLEERRNAGLSFAFAARI